MQSIFKIQKNSDFLDYFGTASGSWILKIQNWIIFYWLIKSNWRFYPASRYQIVMWPGVKCPRQAIQIKILHKNQLKPQKIWTYWTLWCWRWKLTNGSPEFKYAIGLSKPTQRPENRFYWITLNNRRNKKTSNKIDWNNFTLQIHVSHYLVFMIQILLSIELPNDGALGKKGDYYIEEEGGF